jgi:prepilin-type N-terminal cleavage/methylation domain-containing protein
VADPPVMKQNIFTKKVFRSKSDVSFPFSLLLRVSSTSVFNKKGFSIVEIITTMFLIGILTAIAIPQTKVWIDHYRLRGATRLVWGDLQSAKMTAIKTNQTITVTFDSTTSYSFSQAGSTIFTRNLTQDYPAITIAKTGGGNLTFGSTGLTQNATITIQGLDNSKSVTTLWTGRILST